MHAYYRAVHRPDAPFWHWAKFAEEQFRITVYLAIHQKPRWLSGRLELPRDRDDLERGMESPPLGLAGPLVSLPRLISFWNSGEFDVYHSYLLSRMFHCQVGLRILAGMARKELCMVDIHNYGIHLLVQTFDIGMI